MPQASLRDAIGQGRVPTEALREMADQYSGQGQEERAVSLLESLFAGKIHKTNEAADYALNLLCNCYDELGLARLVVLYLRSGDETAAMDRAQQLLALNPNDNHGFRSIVVNQWLFDGNDESVLEITRNYPQDVQPEIPYGQVLALYRLQRLEEAQTALGVAMKVLPKVAHYLTAKRVRKPKLDPMGVTFGGDDQAWIYRDEMRVLWLETPGAIEWLMRTAKQINE